MKKNLIFLFLAPLLMAATCEDNDDVLLEPCTTVAMPGLQVTVKDAADNSVLTQGVTVVATDTNEPYTESLSLSNSASTIFEGAHERAGTYTVTVNKPGYQAVTSQAVTVVRDRCHVETQTLEISLTAQ